MRILYSLFFIAFIFFLSIWVTSQIVYSYGCSISSDGIDEKLYLYLCRVDVCVRNFIQDSRFDKFEVLWRRVPHNLNWCSTNAQMSVLKFATKNELVLQKVRNMIDDKESSTNCSGIIVSFDGDNSIQQLGLERQLVQCTIESLQFSHQESGGISNLLRNVKTVIDLIVIGPSKSSSYLLFQQFLSDYDNIMPVICQVNFVYSLPKTSEENGFFESLERLRTNSKYILIGSSKARNDMYLNLFFVNFKDAYCRDRYLRYFSFY